MLYSGTVAAGIEGAFFGIAGVAVSLEFDEHARYNRAARLAREIIAQILAQKKGPEPQLYNLNIPTAALLGRPGGLHGADERRPLRGAFPETARSLGTRVFLAGRRAVAGRPPADQTDRSALDEGKVTITPLDYNLTRRPAAHGGNGAAGSFACPSRPTTARRP